MQSLRWRALGRSRQRTGDGPPRLMSSAFMALSVALLGLHVLLLPLARTPGF
jgi:hypothetical protein